MIPIVLFERQDWIKCTEKYNRYKIYEKCSLLPDGKKKFSNPVYVYDYGNCLKISKKKTLGTVDSWTKVCLQNGKIKIYSVSKFDGGLRIRTKCNIGELEGLSTAKERFLKIFNLFLIRNNLATAGTNLDKFFVNYFAPDLNFFFNLDDEKELNKACLLKNATPWIFRGNKSKDDFWKRYLGFVPTTDLRDSLDKVWAASAAKGLINEREFVSIFCFDHFSFHFPKYKNLRSNLRFFLKQYISPKSKSNKKRLVVERVLNAGLHRKANLFKRFSLKLPTNRIINSLDIKRFEEKVLKNLTAENIKVGKKILQLNGQKIGSVSLLTEPKIIESQYKKLNHFFLKKQILNGSNFIFLDDGIHKEGNCIIFDNKEYIETFNYRILGTTQEKSAYPQIVRYLEDKGILKKRRIDKVKVQQTANVTPVISASSNNSAAVGVPF